MTTNSFIEKQLVSEQFINRENQLHHLAFEREFTFYKAVADGNLDKVNEIFLPLKSEGLGQLSDNNIRNMKYHLIITVALLTRFCIEAGMLPEDAYSLSDIYIRRLDHLESERDISALHKEVVYDYTNRMKKHERGRNHSFHVSMAIDYIYSHLHGQISLDQIANELKLNKTYLCKLFLQETGFTIGNYILHCKIDAAMNMLKYSEYSCLDIGNYLGFSSQSHFITSFKKLVHQTPREYRNKHFRKEFT